MLDAATGHVFLTNGGGGDVWMFDACSGKLLQTIVLGANIYGGTLDARNVEGSSWRNPGPDHSYMATNVLVLDTRTGKVLQTIAVPQTAQHVYQPMRTAVAESSGRLWVLSMCVAKGRLKVRRPVRKGLTCTTRAPSSCVKSPKSDRSAVP